MSSPPPAVKAIALFFAFGAAMSGLAAFLLTFPGTPLDHAWRINPAAQAGLMSLGGGAVLLMLAVGASCGAAGIGLWRGRAWGYWTAIIVLAVNLVGNALNAFIAHDWRTLIGLPIAAVIIVYLLRQLRTVKER